MNMFLDYFFVVFHGTLVLFNLTGWAFKRARRLHLATMGATLLSWFGLGIFFGWGYCPSTEWHWDVKRKLGETDLPASYLKYYADRLTGVNWDPNMLAAVTMCLGTAAFVLSSWLNWRDFKGCRSSPRHNLSGR